MAKLEYSSQFAMVINLQLRPCDFIIMNTFLLPQPLQKHLIDAKVMMTLAGDSENNGVNFFRTHYINVYLIIDKPVQKAVLFQQKPCYN